MESIAEEIVREILLKLPTRDVIRCRRVSRQWRGLLTDPSFIGLHAHAAHVVSGPGAEALVATEIGGPHVDQEIVIINALSGKPMYRVPDLDTSYRPTNACNGFILLASGVKNKPVYVCNPATGEMQKVSPPPETEDVYGRSFAMGFSPSTGQYKLFRLCFRVSTGWPEEHCMEAYTLGDQGGGSWRRHPHTFPYRAVHQPPPVLVDGKLYVLTKRPESRLVVPNWDGKPDRMLVIDVTSEAHGTYCLPEELTGEVTVVVHALELGGRLRVARRVVSSGQLLLHFWVMEPLRRDGLDQKKGRSLHARWELRYTFYMDERDGSGRYDYPPSGVWLDHGHGMLCYKLGDSLYIYNTTKDMERKKVGGLSQWDYQNHPSVAPSTVNNQRWNVYGGYRPSLLSPHHLAFRRKDDEQEQFQHDPGHAKQLSKKRCSTCPPDCDSHPAPCCQED